MQFRTSHASAKELHEVETDFIAAAHPQASQFSRGGGGAIRHKRFTGGRGSKGGEGRVNGGGRGITLLEEGMLSRDNNVTSGSRGSCGADKVVVDSGGEESVGATLTV